MSTVTSDATDRWLRVLASTAVGFAIYIWCAEFWFGHGFLALLPALVAGMTMNIVLQRTWNFTEVDEQ